MNITDLPTLSTTLLGVSSILGAYLLALKIKEANQEKPDPKTTYATIKQLESINNKINNHENKYQKNIQNLRLEVKNDYQIHDQSLHRSSENLHNLIRKTIQDTAALKAQSQIIQARITELTLKTDKILSKINL